MEQFLNMLKKDENCLSIGRLCAVIAFLMFVCVSLFLAITGKTWMNYGDFAMACVGFMLAQLGNKFVETRGLKVSSSATKEVKKDVR